MSEVGNVLLCPLLVLVTVQLHVATAGERTENSGVDVFCSTIHFNLTTAEMRTPMTE